MLYFAYGSNLNKAAMLRRCPDATPLCKFLMPDSRLVFRGVADIIEEPGAVCAGGVWRLTARCEAALDRYEGVAGGFYRKVLLPVRAPGDDREMLVYVMNSSGVMPPNHRYLQTIADGYRDFDLPLDSLVEAVRASWDQKDKTFFERRRRHRDGYVPLAKPSAIVLPEKTGKATTGAKVASKSRKARKWSKSK